MTKVAFSFVLTTLAGASTMLGTIPIFFHQKNEEGMIAGSLAFAAGVMFCVSVTDLLPEAILMLEKSCSGMMTIILTFVFLLIGMFFSLVIDRVMPTRTQNGLYKIGIISMIAIILHNLPEGIATFISTTRDTSLGISLAMAIAFHNIPEGISISVPLYYATNRKGRALLYTFISALSEPLGAVLTYFFLLPFITDMILGLLFAFIAGIMIYISWVELLPTSLSYQNSSLTRNFFVIGILFMLVKFFI